MTLDKTGVVAYIDSEMHGHYRDKIIRKRPLTPRMRQALRLYHSGIVPTKKEAAQAVGLSTTTFYIQTAAVIGDPQVKSLATKIDQMVEDETIATSILIERLGRQAIGVLGNLMHGAESEPVKLAAAKDLADRSPETAKTQKMQVESFTLNGRDAKALAEAMVEAARVREKHRVSVQDDYIRLEGGLDGAEAIPAPSESTPIVVVTGDTEAKG